MSTDAPPAQWSLTALGNIGDAVIACDVQGRVTFMNSVAESLCGRSEREAVGGPLEEVFRIVNGATRAPAENPVSKVLRSGVVMGLANHAVLIARDGAETPIDGSAAPIRGDGGDIQGVVLVFRDVGEKKRSERRLSAQHETARILAESKGVGEAVPQLLEAVCLNLGWDFGGFWRVDEDAKRLRCIELWHAPSFEASEFDADSRARTFPRGEGLPGKVWESGTPRWLYDVAEEADLPRHGAAARSGLHGAFAFPVAVAGKCLGVMEFFGRIVREPEEEVLAMMATIGRQVGQFVERKLAEESCRESEALKGAILASALDCVITIDDEDRVIEWNQAAERTFGYDRTDVLGRRMGELIVPPEHRDRHYRGMARYLETGEGTVLGKRIEITAMRRDGSLFPVELAITPIRLETRQLFTAYLRDITARKRAAGELAWSEERYRTFIRQSSEGIWRFEASEPIELGRPEDGVIEDFYRVGSLAECNDAFARMHGFASAADIVGTRLADFLPRSDPHNVAYLRAFIRSGFRLDENESHEVDRDGRPKHFLNTLVGIVEDGRLVRAWGTQRDVTEQKRAEEHQTLLAEAGRILGSSLDYEATLASVCKLAVPRLADWCTLDLVTEDGGHRRLQVAHRDPGKVELAEELRRRYPPDPGDDRGLMNVLRTGEPEHYPEIPDEMLVAGARDAEHLDILRALGLKSALIVPLQARGRTVGALTLVTAESGRRYGDDELRLATELASRAALAVDNSRLFEEAQEAVRVRDEAVSLHRGMEEQLTLLVEASSSLSVSLDFEAVLNAVLALSRRLISADAYAVWRHRPEAGRWGIELASGLSQGYQDSSIEVVERTPAMPETAIVAEDVHENPRLGSRSEAYGREGIRSLMSVPLRVRGDISGTLVFYYRGPHRFSEIEVRVATALANLAGTAIGTSELYQELRENDRRKDQFLAMLAHELRNPLSSIGNAATLLKMANAEEQRDWAREVVERQTKHVARLVDDLLDVSRITRGLVSLKKENIDPAPVFDAAVEAARTLIEVRKHKLFVSYRAGALRLDADPTRLEQILVNLLTNAAKYTDDGGEIRLSAERDGDAVVIVVSDNGMGIPPALLPKMFELFAQGDRTLARSEGGLGIGLTLVRTLAEMHGGSIVARSEGPGTGSTFTVRLPAAPPPEPTQRPAEVPAKKLERRGSRVLVVDDNRDTARAMGRILKLLGNDVQVAHDGPEAIGAAREHRPEFVLLDIGLPGMDGYEVARRLRREECCRGAVMIAVTGYGQDEDRRRSKEAGFDHHLIKPLDHEALISLLSSGENGP